MDPSEDVADLHIHTTASDGTCSVADRVEQAIDRNLRTIAVTDHDCISESLDGRVARRAGIELVTGVEVRGDVRDTKVEILGYYVDPDADELERVLLRARRYRRKRNREMVENLADTTGLDLEYERLRERADGMLGRPHMAGAIVDTGVVDSIGTAFEEYLGTGGVAYVPMQRIPAEEVIAAIQAAGGVASLAHPGRIRSDREGVAAIISDLVETNLDALEVRYPYAEAPSEGYADVSIEEAGAFAEQYGLLPTGGSDCHGPDSGKFRVGEVRIPEQWIDAVRDRAAERRAF